MAFFEDSDDPDDWAVMRIPEHRLIFGDMYLKFDITIDADLEMIDYAFHHAVIGSGLLIWRACKNEHRIDVTGSPCHVHINRDDNVQVSAEVDLQDAIRAVQQRQIPGI